MEAAEPPADVNQRVPARIVLASIAALWLCYFGLATLRGWLVGLGMFDELLWRRALVILASMAVTVALWPLLRLLDRQRLWIKSLAVIVIALPASLLLAAINQRVFAPIENTVTTKIGEREGLRIRSDEAGNLMVDPLDRDGVQPPAGAAPHVQAGKPAAITIAAEIREDNRLRQLADVAFGRYFLLLAWGALYFAMVAAEQARIAERREGTYRRAAKAAELRSLRYQVNPHFLFNTLNSLSALVITGKTAEAERMIQTLSGFYRRSLAGDPTGDVELEHEVALQRLYLEIEAVRFPDRLVVRYDIPEALGRAWVPGMILQPLVENAVKYGVATTTRAVTLRISAREEYGMLVLEVADDGPGDGFAKGAACNGGFGIGLANVRDRLAARYGDSASLTAGPAPGGGWLALIRMPLVAHD